MRATRTCFSAELVERLGDGYEIGDIERFQEGALPRDLFCVMLRKPLASR